MKKKISKILCGVCLLGMCCISLIGCGNKKGTLTYEFIGTEAQKAGYAEGTITFETKEVGNYNLYWSDETGA